MFIGRTDAEAEAPRIWPHDVMSQFIGKDPDVGKHWGQEEKGTTEDEIAGWHHRLNGHKFEQTPGDSEGQGSPMCCSPWGCRESDTTEQQQQAQMQIFQPGNTFFVFRRTLKCLKRSSWPWFLLEIHQVSGIWKQQMGLMESTWGGDSANQKTGSI